MSEEIIAIIEKELGFGAVEAVIKDNVYKVNQPMILKKVLEIFSRQHLISSISLDKNIFEEEFHWIVVKPK